MTATPPPEPPATGHPDLPPSAYARISAVLRAGLSAALAILAVTLVLDVAHEPGASAEALVASNPMLHYLGITELAAGIASGAPAALLTLGLLVLVATPLLRIASAAVYFGRNGERRVTGIAVAVLVLLLVGLLVIGPIVR